MITSDWEDICLGGTNRFAKKQFEKIGLIYHLEILNFKTIGKNLVLAHPSGITVNPKAVIGDDCVIFKNVTIGSIRSGKMEGVPQIGNPGIIHHKEEATKDYPSTFDV